MGDHRLGETILIATSGLVIIGATFFWYPNQIKSNIYFRQIIKTDIHLYLKFSLKLSEGYRIGTLIAERPFFICAPEILSKINIINISFKFIIEIKHNKTKKYYELQIQPQIIYNNGSDPHN